MVDEVIQDALASVGKRVKHHGGEVVAENTPRGTITRGGDFEFDITVVVREGFGAISKYDTVLD